MAQLKDLLVNGASRFVGKIYANGGIALNSSTAEQVPEYILGIKPFADGGDIIWESKANVSVGYATNAGTATSATNDAAGNEISSTYLKKVDYSSTDTKNTAGSTNLSNTKLYIIGATTQEANPQTYSNSAVYISTNNVLMGAAWNDFAEFRRSNIKEAGRVVCENGDGTLSLATKRLQPGAEVISDTFGFAIGETEFCKTPVAVAGRVLVFPYEDINTYSVGDAVCSAPNGTVSRMTRKEIKEYPERIVGTVSEIPNYKYWNSTVEVNGRIWIKLR